MHEEKDGFTGDYIRYNIAAAGMIINVADLDPHQTKKVGSGSGSR
jgi:hypothetical protein